MEKKRVLGYYDYTVVLTYIGMFFAFIGILGAINGSFLLSIICLMFAGVCDMFDGAVASTKERNAYEKHFGIQIDSMCDLLSFGVLPAIFVYMFQERNVVVGVIATAFVLCALIRLSYFNVQEFERQKQEVGPRKVYLGVPVTTVALLMPLLFVIYADFFPNCGICFTVMLVVLGIGFLSGVEIKKPGNVGKAIMILIGIGEIVGIVLLARAGIV